MTEYTKCPSLDCQSKVKLWPIEDGLGVNFCCLNCWTWTWARMSEAVEEMPEGFAEHSVACDARQAKRKSEPLKDLPEGTVLTIMGRQHYDAIKALRALDEDPVSPV